MKEAMYYEKKEKSQVRCFLCPHNCIIADGKLGICRVRKNQNGTLYSMNYGKITSYAYDPIEKKPLYHFYPNSNIFSIGSFGCNLACDFCQNWEIVYDDSFAREISDSDIITMAKAKNSIGLAFTYNEPSIWYEYILDLSKQLKENQLKTVMVTNGYINEEPLKKLLPHVDAMNIDLKAMDNSFYTSVCKGKLDPVLKTIELAAKSTHVEITTLLIGGKNTSTEDIRNLAKTIAEINPGIPLHLSRYYPAYKMDIPATNVEILLNAKRICKEYLDYVYIGNVPGVDNNTYCKSCHVRLIDRNIRSKNIGIEDGKCTKCGYNVYGKYNT